jgi:hypothetical protein
VEDKVSVEVWGDEDMDFYCIYVGIDVCAHAHAHAHAHVYAYDYDYDYDYDYVSVGNWMNFRWS